MEVRGKVQRVFNYSRSDMNPILVFSRDVLLERCRVGDSSVSHFRVCIMIFYEGDFSEFQGYLK